MNMMMKTTKTAASISRLGFRLLPHCQLPLSHYSSSVRVRKNHRDAPPVAKIKTSKKKVDDVIKLILNHDPRQDSPPLLPIFNPFTPIFSGLFHRQFSVGDFIRIGDTEGVVTQKRITHTFVRFEEGERVIPTYKFSSWKYAVIPKKNRGKRDKDKFCCMHAALNGLIKPPASKSGGL